MARALAQTLVLAFLFSVAIFLHVLSGALYDNWWPLLVLIAYVLAPLPLCLFARASGGDSLFGDTGSKAAQHWAEFLSTTLVSLIVGIPFVLWHVGVVEAGSALMALAGFLLVCITAGLAAVFARAEYSGDSWGGGVALFGA